jgi:hypothetical protein
MDTKLILYKYLSQSISPTLTINQCSNFKDSRKAITRLMLQHEHEKEFQYETYVLGLIYGNPNEVSEIRLSSTINLNQSERKKTGVNRVLYRNIGVEVTEVENIRGKEDCYCDTDPVETLLVKACHISKPAIRKQNEKYTVDNRRNPTSVTVFGTKEDMYELFDSISIDNQVVGVCAVCVIDVLKYMDIQTYEERETMMRYYDRHDEWTGDDS